MVEDMAGRSWRLSAPETYVLVNGPGASPKETLKLAFTELVASGRVKLTGKLMEPGQRLGSLRPPLQNAFAAFEREYSTGGSLDVAKVARALVREHGSLAGYRDNVVMRSLLDDGLFVAEQYRILWVIPATRHVLTPAGEAARADLQEMKERQPAWQSSGDTAAMMPIWMIATMASSDMNGLDEAMSEIDSGLSDAGGDSSGGDSGGGDGGGGGD